MLLNIIIIIIIKKLKAGLMRLACIPIFVTGDVPKGRQATGTAKQFQFTLLIEQLGALLMEFEPSVHQPSLSHVITVSSFVCFLLFTVFFCLLFLMQYA
jgi:hypothetical protein